MSCHDFHSADRTQRTKNVIQALWFAKNKLPYAVRKETGEALDEVLSGILPAILMALAIVAGCTLVGLSLGALGGAIAGVGVGAVPGAIAGSSAGFTAGIWILEWMGLAFLAVHVGNNMYQVTRLVESGFNDAWGRGARGVFGLSSSDLMHSGHDKIPGHSQVIAASEKFAQAVAVLIRLVLEGVVLYLTARGIAKLPELVAQLRSSRLGAGFATWVEKNHLRLMSNPKLMQSTGSVGVAQKPVKVLDHTNVPEQPRPGKKKVTKAGKEKLRPGSPEHKAARWDKYQKRNGTFGYEAWSKKYDTAINNQRYGQAREQKYREMIGGVDETLKTPYTNRQLDIYKPDEMYIGQLKTGKESLTRENIMAIKKDRWFVKEGFTVEHILENNASKPYINACKKAGIKVTIGPQIP
jgi:hypothetical protein